MNVCFRSMCTRGNAYASCNRLKARSTGIFWFCKRLSNLYAVCSMMSPSTAKKKTMTQRQD